MNNQIRISSAVNSEIVCLKNISDEVRTAITEQNIAFSEIVKSNDYINTLSQSNAESSEQLVSIAKSIAELSKTLDSHVNFFKA
jgi:methyl-accepting chemotaxis protein